MFAIVTSVLVQAKPTFRIERSHPDLPADEAHKQAFKNDSPIGVKNGPYPGEECFFGRTGAGEAFGAGEGRAAALRARGRLAVFSGSRPKLPEIDRRRQLLQRLPLADTAPKCSLKFQKLRCLGIPTSNSANPRESRPYAKRNGPSEAVAL